MQSYAGYCSIFTDLYISCLCDYGETGDRVMYVPSVFIWIVIFKCHFGYPGVWYTWVFSLPPAMPLLIKLLNYDV